MVRRSKMDLCGSHGDDTENLETFWSNPPFPPPWTGIAHVQSALMVIRVKCPNQKGFRSKVPR